MFSLAGCLGFQPRLEKRTKLKKSTCCPGGEADDLARMEEEWNNRLTYPTGRFNQRGSARQRFRTYG